MPLERIILASDWREDHIPVLSYVGIEKVNQALARLTKWVLHFNRMISFYICATEEDNDPTTNSVLTLLKEKKLKEIRKKESEKMVNGEGSKRHLIHRSGSRMDLMRGDSKKNLKRGSSKRLLRGESSREMKLDSFAEDSNKCVNMHELITRNASKSFSKDNDENTRLMSDIDFAAAAKEYESEYSRPSSRDPILGRRRVSVISQILQQDNRKLSVSQMPSFEKKENNHMDVRGANISEKAEPVNADLSETKTEKTSSFLHRGIAPVHTAPDFEAQFWKSIGAAFMLDDKGQIILSNGKDIALYQDMLLGDETVTSDYSKFKLSGSDLALTTRRRKIVAANRDLIHNYVGTLIRQVSKEYLAGSNSDTF